MSNKTHADDPVEFARRLVGAGVKHARHVQDDHQHHRVRRPAMHVARELAERHRQLNVLHRRIRALDRRARSRTSSITPVKVSTANRIVAMTPRPNEYDQRMLLAADLDRVQVKENVARHRQ